MAKQPGLTQEEIIEFERLLALGRAKKEEKKRKKRKIRLSSFDKIPQEDAEIEELAENRAEKLLSSFFRMGNYIKAWVDMRLAHDQSDQLRMFIAEAAKEIQEILDGMEVDILATVRAQGLAVHIDKYSEYYRRYMGIYLEADWHPVYRRPIRMLCIDRSLIEEDFDPIEDVKQKILSRNRSMINEAREY